MLTTTTTARAAPTTTVPAPQPITLTTRILTLIIIFGPLLGTAVGMASLWGRGFSWAELGLLVGMYLATGLGITVGFHRLFAHRAFETYGSVQFVLAALGSMAVQAPLLRWVAVHRLHHRHSDREDDPHSPHQEGSGLAGLLRGVWHAHIGWVFQPEVPCLAHYVKDLAQNRVVRRAQALMPVWIAAGLLIPAVLGGLLAGSWAGALFGLVWGGLVRIFLVHHVTWSVNSICHLWGRRPYGTGDQSRNNLLFGILALGEGWHNNHHAFPSSARHGLRWWQLDISYWAIRGLALVGLAWREGRGDIGEGRGDIVGFRTRTAGGARGPENRTCQGAIPSQQLWAEAPTPWSSLKGAALPAAR
jgi:stearoyl-CoA desaturase (delta-9 desaturase)